MKSRYAEAFKSRLREQTLKDITGLDAATCGFGRPECCGAIPKGLPGSSKLGLHFYFSTIVPPTEWEKRSENIPGCTSVQAAVAREFPGAGFTAFYDPQRSSAHAARLLRFDPSHLPSAGGAALERTISLPCDESVTAVPLWKDSPSTATERTLSEEAFVFVCAHTSRDARCGYCGPILADLLEQTFDAQKATAKADGSVAPSVNVHRCAHVGGHIYAGNVFVYSKHGAVSYGLVTPDDIESIAQSVLEHKGVIPARLKERVRGKAGGVRALE